MREPTPSEYGAVIDKTIHAFGILGDKVIDTGQRSARTIEIARVGVNFRPFVILLGDTGQGNDREAYCCNKRFDCFHSYSPMLAQSAGEGSIDRANYLSRLALLLYCSQRLESYRLKLVTFVPGWHLVGIRNCETGPEPDQRILNCPAKIPVWIVFV